MNSATSTLVAHLERVEERPGGLHRSECPSCKEDGFWLQADRFSCYSCQWQGTHAELLSFFSDGEAETNSLPRAIPASEASEDAIPTYLAEDLILEAEIHVAGSDGGVGKTSLGLAICGAVASGFAVFDRFPVLSSGPVLFVSEEDSEAVLRNRLEALCKGHGWPTEQVLSRVHILCLKQVQIDRAHWQKHLIEEALRVGARLVVLDPLCELTGGDENSNSEAKGYIRFLRRLCTETGAAVLLLAHLGKAGEGKRKIDRLRGASALYSAARAVFFLNRDIRGIAVEPVKFNRAELPDRFVISRTVETDPDNKALWRSARLTYLTAEVAQEKGAESMVREALAKTPGLMTTQLRRLVKGTGISSEEVSKAIKSMHNQGVIRFDPGERNKKFWHLVEPAGNAGQARQVELLSLPEPAGQVRIAPHEPDGPVRGQAGAGPGTDSDVCVDCGTTVPADPSFSALRCTQCAIRAGRDRG